MNKLSWHPVLLFLIGKPFIVGKELDTTFFHLRVGRWGGSSKKEDSLFGLVGWLVWGLTAL